MVALSSQTYQESGGELNAFLVDVDQGVTHLSLTVEADNTITPTLNQGKTSNRNARISRITCEPCINYDLFHDATPKMQMMTEQSMVDTIQQLITQL